MVPEAGAGAVLVRQLYAFTLEASTQCVASGGCGRGTRPGMPPKGVYEKTDSKSRRRRRRTLRVVQPRPNAHAMAALDVPALNAHIAHAWDNGIQSTLEKYITIPNQSPMFDPCVLWARGRGAGAAALEGGGARRRATPQSAGMTYHTRVHATHIAPPSRPTPQTAPGRRTGTSTPSSRSFPSGSPRRRFPASSSR